METKKEHIGWLNERIQFAKRNGGWELIAWDLNWLWQWWNRQTAERRAIYAIVGVASIVMFISIGHTGNDTGRAAVSQTSTPVTPKANLNPSGIPTNQDADDLKKEELFEQQLMQKADQLKEQSSKFEEKCMSSWDGSCIPVVEYVKAHMNDPESFEHVETRYTNKGDYFLIMMSFRGKNAFGGVVLNNIKVRVNSECNVIAVEE